jgi:ribosomal protein S18 acetylase RimI-like enzyme
VIAPADDVSVVRGLIVEYAQSLGVDLQFQDFDRELATLDTYYELMLVARVGGEVAGCIALRRIDDATCEMKRLYVRPRFRGQDLGRALAEAIIAEARARGYARMRLDTLPSMRTAMALYESLGFRDITAYRFNPIEGSRFLELDL